MFKLYEKDKCKNLALDISNSLVANLVPGKILYDGDNGAVDAVAADGDGPYTISAENAGRFYICMDYYANTINAKLHSTIEPNLGTSPAGSISNAIIAAVPVLEKFDAVVPIAEALSKGDLLTIVDGVIEKEDGGDQFVFAMVTEDNDFSDVAVDTKITTWMFPHVTASEG